MTTSTRVSAAQTAPSEPGFVVVERFGPTWPAWAKFAEWARMPQLTELATLDGMLCPPRVKEMGEDDWAHAVGGGLFFGVFRSAEYALRRTPLDEKSRLLRIIVEPAEDVCSDRTPGWRFLGYDLVDEIGGTSALINCGGFDDVFAPDQVSSRGLIDGFAEAARIQMELRVRHPNEHHADCLKVAVWGPS